MNLRLSCVLSCAAFLVFQSVGWSQVVSVEPQVKQYQVRELPRLNGFATRVFDMNNSGEAVGYMLDSALSWRALYWDRAGNVTDLGGAGQVSMALGIAENGLISGFHGGSFSSTDPVIWTTPSMGSMVTLGALPGSSPGDAYDVNSFGLVVGANYRFGPVATSWQGNQIMELANWDSYAFDLNDAGQAIGRDETSGWAEAAVWENGLQTILPGLNGNHESPTDISEGGWISGGALSGATSKFHAVVWDPQTLDIQDLGLYLGFHSTSAWSVNDHGVAVGTYTLVPATSETRAMLWIDGKAMDLNDLIPATSGWTLMEARVINNKGWIAGWGYRSGFSGERAFLLTP